MTTRTRKDGDEGHLVLRGSSEVKGYISDLGYICLVQDRDDPAYGNEPSLITMLPNQIPELITWLQKQLD